MSVDGSRGVDESRRVDESQSISRADQNRGAQGAQNAQGAQGAGTDAASLADRVKLLRRLNHLNQKDMARSIGVSSGFISVIETGKSGLSAENVNIICETYHVRADWLVYGKGEMKSDDPDDWIWRPEAKDFRGLRARLIELRKANQLTQKEFGERIDSSRELIALVERGRTDPTEKFLAKIEKAFGVEHQWLIDGVLPQYVLEPGTTAPSSPQPASSLINHESADADSSEAESAEPVVDPLTAAAQGVAKAQNVAPVDAAAVDTLNAAPRSIPHYFLHLLQQMSDAELQRVMDFAAGVMARKGIG